MKIEKVNDHQIRCTLTKADLLDRELKISELAYGTDKAKDLFRDMMQQASFEFGFEAEDIPLMIEAIPLNSDCIVLIITKVEDPEELDTRFSKFAPSLLDNEDPTNMEHADHALDKLLAGADDVLDMLKKFQEDTSTTNQPKPADSSQPESEKSTSFEPRRLKTKPSLGLATSIELTRIYSFTSISTLSKVATVLGNYYNGVNTLYKHAQRNCYILVMTKTTHSTEEFNKVCNILSEYGDSEVYTNGTTGFLAEHCEIILADNALQTLSQI